MPGAIMAIIQFKMQITCNSIGVNVMVHICSVNYIIIMLTTITYICM